jgi:bifunctional non-homologous end joining protein LigD
MSAVPDYQPQLALLVKAVPKGNEWVHELKYDGYRIGCRIDRGRLSLISRNGKDWTHAFPEVVSAARKLSVKQAVLDGEVAIVLPDGRTSFQALQNVLSLSGGVRRGLVYFVFDLLYIDSEDLRATPLDERKARLLAIVGKPGARSIIRFAEHVIGDGDAVFREACRLGLEGIVSKRRDLAYHTGRHGGWVKTKCVNRQEFVVGGFTDPEGSRAGIGALLIGYYRPGAPGELIFAGKVGTGFTQRLALDLRARLEELEQPTSPFAKPPPGWLGKNAHWVRPELVAEVAFTEWTDEGKIRHPSFQGLRADKRAREVTIERPVDVEVSGTARGARPFRAGKTEPKTSKANVRTRHDNTATEVAGVKLTHPDRVLFPEENLTKLDLARYYESIESWIVPHLAGRPLTLVRCPEGATAECFYMKHSKVWAPAPLRRVDIPEKTKVGEYLIVDDLPGLIGLVQMSVLEVHTWNSRFENVERPDRIVLDVDPGPDVTWAQVIAAARIVRGVVGALGLESFVKTTGGRGLHVVVPLEPRADWELCLAWSRAVAEAIVRQDPATFTTTFAKAGRQRKILIDYLRNNRTNTSVAAFSTRAKPRAPVSVPLTWEELSPKSKSDACTVKTVGRRLAKLRGDPWAHYWKLKERIDKKMIAALRRL